MDIPRELVEQFARGNGVLFVGAGLSQEAGLLGWSELLASLADSIDLPPHLRADPLKVAQHYENKRGRQALVSHVIEQTDTTGKEPTDNHRRLVRLGVHTWVTTNYDDLLDQTLREAGKRYTAVVRDENLPYVSTDAVMLIKLHGDRQQPDTIVITEQDYYTYFRRFPRVKDKLTGLLLEKTPLFVGYSINDPDFNQIHTEIAFDLQQHQRMAYAILFDADEFALSDLRSRNIHVLNIATGGQANYSERLGELLDDLIRQVDRARQQRTKATHPVVVAPAHPEAEDARGLLEAMGYRITDTQAVGGDLYFLCDAKWGAEIRQEVVHFVAKEPTAGDIAAFNDAAVSHGAARGTLLTQQSLPAALCDLVRQRERIQCYTLDEFTDRLADFCPYLERLIQEYEAGEIPAFYVTLAVEGEAGEDQAPQIFKPLESFVDAWLTEPGRNHLSILGDFGSGKTWFCQRYAYLAARRYLADPARNRIPILITLRDYSRAYDVEQLITDAIANRYKVGLAAGYKTFARLNEAGRLLLIFDGFDEMERGVSDYRTTVDNFWELAKVVYPATKVLLTCRTAYFRHRGEEEETLSPRRRRVSVVAGDQVIDLRGQDRFEVVYLLDFDDEDIQLALQKRLLDRWEPIYKRIQELSNLRDLASRPVLLDMIVKTLPQIQDASEINQATLYEAYVDALLKRRWSEDTDHIPPQDRLFFMQELAWEMYQTQKLSIPFSEFPERVTKHFGLKDDPERAAFFERDIRTQSYLVRDDAGNYRFAHKSFMEYLVARKMADVISGLSFDVEKAVEIWKTPRVTSEVQDFLLPMVADPAPLWQLIEATRGRSIADVDYAGGNAITLLRMKGQSFQGVKLAHTVLAGADLRNVNLSDAEFDEADLSYSSLSNSQLTGSHFRATNLRQAILTNAVLEQTNFKGANLSEVILEEMEEVLSVAWSPDGKYIATGGNDACPRVWSARTGEVIARGIAHVGPILTITWTRDGLWSACQGLVYEECIPEWLEDANAHTWAFYRYYTYPYPEIANPFCLDPIRRQLLVILKGTAGWWDFEYNGLRALYSSDERSSGWIHRPVCAAAHTAELSYVAIGCYDGRLKVIASVSGEKESWSRGVVVSNRQVTAVAFASNGKYLGAVTRDGKLGLWKIPSLRRLALWHFDIQPTCLDVDSSCSRAVVSSGTMLLLWQKSSGRLDVLGRQGGLITDIAFNPTETLIAASSNDATIHIWDVNPDSSTFGQCLMVLEVKMSCQGMRISGAKGLDAPAPDGKGTLRDWLIARGAME